MDNRELTPRQWALYRLLMSNPNHWFTKKEICENITDYPFYENQTNQCPHIAEDKIAINGNMRVDKLIVIKHNCFKIATKEEYQRERASHIKRLKTQAQQIQDMDAKYQQDGYAKLFNNLLNELTDDNEQIHETFIEKETPQSADQSINDSEVSL